MKKIIDYMIYEAPNREDLVNDIKLVMKDGWQPLGGISFNETYDSEGSQWKKYVQALVKYES